MEWVKIYVHENTVFMNIFNFQFNFIPFVRSFYDKWDICWCSLPVSTLTNKIRISIRLMGLIIDFYKMSTRMQIGWPQGTIR